VKNQRKKHVCCDFNNSKEKIICNGIDLQTKEVVQFQLPKSIINKLQNAINQKPSIFQKLIMLFEKLFGQPPRRKVITITANNKSYELKTDEL